MEFPGHNDLVGRLDDLLNSAIQRVSRDVMGLIKGKLTPAQYAVLRLLQDEIQMTVSQMAEAFEITPSAVTALSSKLVEANLVERCRDQSDRRVVWIRLTHEGDKMIAELRAVKRKMVEAYVETLSNDEIRHLISILARILA